MIHKSIHIFIYASTCVEVHTDVWVFIFRLSVWTILQDFNFQITRYYKFAGAPIGTKNCQCWTGQGISGYVRIGGRYWPQSCPGLPRRGRKTTSAMALVALARWAPLDMINDNGCYIANRFNLFPLQIFAIYHLWYDPLWKIINISWRNILQQVLDYRDDYVQKKFPVIKKSRELTTSRWFIHAQAINAMIISVAIMTLQNV